MDMQGNRQLSTTQQQAWDALNDAEILKTCIPGCEKFELTGENQYAITVAVKIGPVSAKFNGKVSLKDIQAPLSYSLLFDAQGGVAGFGQGESKVELVANELGCDLRYTVHSKVGGKIAQLGQRLIDGVAKSLAEDFFKRFDLALQARYPSMAQAGLDGAVTDTVNETPVQTEKIAGHATSPKWPWLVAVAIVAGVFAWYLTK